MEIKHIDNENKGTFKAIIENEVAGEMTYTWAGTNKIIIDHTDVNASYNGKGIGKKLLFSVVDFARNKGIKIIPLCPFAKSVFDKNPDLADVLV